MSSASSPPELLTDPDAHIAIGVADLDQPWPPTIPAIRLSYSGVGVRIDLRMPHAAGQGAPSRCASPGSFRDVGLLVSVMPYFSYSSSSVQVRPTSAAGPSEYVPRGASWLILRSETRNRKNLVLM